MNFTGKLVVVIASVLHIALLPIVAAATVVSLMTPASVVESSHGRDSIAIVTGYGERADDRHWMVVQDPDAATSEPRRSNVIAAHPAWTKALGKSRWISAYPTSSNENDGAYVFETSFTLNAAPSDPHLSLDILADDSASVYLNGREIGSTVMTFPPHPYQQSTRIETRLPEHFIVGRNVLRVVVWNTYRFEMGLDLAGYFKCGNGVAVR